MKYSGDVYSSNRVRNRAARRTWLGSLALIPAPSGAQRALCVPAKLRGGGKHVREKSVSSIVVIGILSVIGGMAGAVKG
jgi:hypothetical protein